LLHEPAPLTLQLIQLMEQFAPSLELFLPGKTCIEHFSRAEAHI
jgi:hypothetical protein